RGRRRRREPYSNPIRAEIRLPPPCEGRQVRSCAPPSIGRPPYRRRRVSRFPHWTSSSILLGVTACASTRIIQHVSPPTVSASMMSHNIFGSSTESASPPLLLGFPLDRWCCRVLHLEPVQRAAGAVGRAKTLRGISYKGPLLFPSR